MKKVCTRCGEHKPLEQFDLHKKGLNGRYCFCKLCRKAISHDRYLRNRAEILQKSSEYYANNRDAVLERHKTYDTTNAESISERRKKQYYANWEKQREKHDASTKRNWDKVLAYHRWYTKKKRVENASYRVHVNVSRRLRQHIRLKKELGATWEAVLGYTTADVIAHLESKFCDGMSWDNYGEWHIDHIVPVAFFRAAEHKHAIAECWALSNLQPLWARDNLRKGARWVG